MSFQDVTRQGDLNAPPTYGGVVRVAGSNTAAAIDLTTMAGWPANQVAGESDQGPLGPNTSPMSHWITVATDGSPIYICLADTYAHATAIDSTTVSTVNGSGTLSAPFTAKASEPIIFGCPQSYWIAPGTFTGAPYGGNSKCRYLGFIVPSGTANIIVWQSSK